jgi:hypothetical protein
MPLSHSPADRAKGYGNFSDRRSQRTTSLDLSRFHRNRHYPVQGYEPFPHIGLFPLKLRQIHPNCPCPMDCGLVKSVSVSFGIDERNSRNVEWRMSSRRIIPAQLERVTKDNNTRSLHHQASGNKRGGIWVITAVLLIVPSAFSSIGQT